MANNTLTDIELENISSHEVKMRCTRIQTPNGMQEEDVSTKYGPLHVTIHGDRKKPAIFTYHDIGLNSVSCFQGLFNYPDMQLIMKHFCVYHIDAPGQQEHSTSLPLSMKHSESEKLLHEMTDLSLSASLGNKRPSLGVIGEDSNPIESYTYPTMDQLAEMLQPVLNQYSVKSFIGIGVGAGANILARFALSQPEKVDGLVLVNCTDTQASWTEWGYQKWNTWYLKSGVITRGIEEYLLWHWFGYKTMETNHDLLVMHMEYIQALNPTNLGHFIDSYIRRTDLGLVREFDPVKKLTEQNFRCPVMLVTGDFSPHLDETIAMNNRLDPSISTWIKYECGGMVLEEVPGKVSESLLLFLQGMSFVPTLRLKSMYAPGSIERKSSDVISGRTALPDPADTRC